MSCLFWGLIPGIGQIHFGTSRRGLLFFATFLFLLNADFVLPLLVSDRVVHSGLIALTVLFWIISFVDNLNLSAECELASK